MSFYHSTTTHNRNKTKYSSIHNPRFIFIQPRNTGMLKFLWSQDKEEDSGSSSSTVSEGEEKKQMKRRNFFLETAVLLKEGAKTYILGNIKTL